MINYLNYIETPFPDAINYFLQNIYLISSRVPDSQSKLQMTETTSEDNVVYNIFIFFLIFL